MLKIWLGLLVAAYVWVTYFKDHHFYPCNRFRQLDGMVYGATHYKRMVSDNCKKSTREFNTCWRSFCLHVFAWRIKLQNHTEKSAYSPPLFTSDLKDDLRCSIYIHSNSEFMNDKQKKNSPIVSHKCSCFGAKMCRKNVQHSNKKSAADISCNKNLSSGLKSQYID